MGPRALDSKTGHPYGKGFDAFRHECPVCLQFWFSNDWCGDGIPERKDPKFVYVPNARDSIVRGQRATPIWMLPPRYRRI